MGKITETLERGYTRLRGARARWLFLLPLLGWGLAFLPLAPAHALWNVWHGLWGWAAFPLALLTALLTRYPADLRELRRLDPRWLLGWELGLFTALGAAAYASASTPERAREIAGWVGWSVFAVLTRLGGRDLAGALLGGMGLLSAYLLLRFAPWTVDRDVFVTWELWLRAQVGPWLGWHLPQRPKPHREGPSRVRRWLEGWRARREDSGSAGLQEEAFLVDVGSGLPPLSLLERDTMGSGTLSQDVRRRAERIRRTLESFGIPVRVVEIHQGPAVTQFCIQPLTKKQGGKVRRVSVRQILARETDLALTLAAAPIRIEAPVPGKPYVGIEVPNPEVEIVRLGGLLASEAFQRIRSPLALALGRDVTGNPVVSDLAKLPHLLIAGATGSGKSVAISAMLVTWLMRNTPHDLRLLLVDPKRVELTNFNGVPHLLGPVVTDVEDTLRALTWAALQMDDRYRLFRQAKVRNIEAYNRWAKEHKKPTLAYIAIVVDELADIMLATKGEAEHLLTRLAQMARATGIHLVVATQRPSVDVITGLIKANFPARLAFAVASQVDSRVILDMPGAEALLGQGDALFLPPDRPSPLRLQGAYVSDEEIERVVTWWQQREGVASDVDVPWKHVELPKEKSLVEQALEVIRGYDRVSPSLLQRKLPVGFHGAQKLLETLEEMGVVGPDEGEGRGRAVLLKKD